MAGARTLAGALTPLVGVAPTNANFTSADYDRKTGLKGNGANKYLNSNRLNNDDPQNSKHIGLYLTEIDTAVNRCYFGGGNIAGASSFSVSNSTQINHRVNTNSNHNYNTNSVGFIGATRPSSSSVTARGGGNSFTFSSTAQTPTNDNNRIFSRTALQTETIARISFYSIGEHLDLALLDARVSTLMSDFQTSIP